MSRFGQNRRIKLDILTLLNHKFEMMLDDGYRKFTLKLHGPKNTPYEGGIWLVNVALTENYPFTSPMVWFETPILHPNIDDTTGFICLDVITQKWTPIYDLVAVFETFLPLLLRYPNPYDPINNLAAIMMQKSPHRYQHAVIKNVQRYASPKKMNDEGKGGEVTDEFETSDLSEDEDFY